MEWSVGQDVGKIPMKGRYMESSKAKRAGESKEHTLCSNSQPFTQSCAASSNVSFHFNAVALCSCLYVFVPFSTAALNLASSVHSGDTV